MVLLMFIIILELSVRIILVNNWRFCFPRLPSRIPVPPVLLSIMDMLAWATPVKWHQFFQCNVMYFAPNRTVRWETSTKPVPDMGDSQIYFSCQRGFTTDKKAFFDPYLVPTWVRGPGKLGPSLSGAQFAVGYSLPTIEEYTEWFFSLVPP